MEALAEGEPVVCVRGEEEQGRMMMCVWMKWAAFVVMGKVYELAWVISFWEEVVEEVEVRAGDGVIVN